MLNIIVANLSPAAPPAPVNFSEPTPAEVAPSFDQVAKPAAKTK